MPAQLRLTLLLIASLLLSACADLGYYLHSVKGHLHIIQQEQDIDELLKDQHTSEHLKQRLRLVQQIRQFAFDHLHLPRSGSYTEYADLQRNYVLKNLFAAAEFSIQAKQWCYPVVGCAGYRGFFEQQRLDDFIAQLRQQHYDVYVANVSAYSTLGWFDDPVLNTFINWPDEFLAGLIFHELSHQLLYVDGDTRFNESFATAVQHAGVEQWLQAHHELDKLQRYQQRIVNRQKVVRLIDQARQALNHLYQQDIDDAEKRRLKAATLEDLKQRYQAFSRSINHSDGFQRWFAGELNNAQLVSVSTYNDWVPFFTQLLQQNHGDFQDFFKQVKQLSDLPRQQRHGCIQHWLDHTQQTVDIDSCTQG
jgi:predicted aminopeptidase